jgi:hypothetical protein
MASALCFAGLAAVQAFLDGKRFVVVRLVVIDGLLRISFQARREIAKRVDQTGQPPDTDQFKQPVPTVNSDPLA